MDIPLDIPLIRLHWGKYFDSSSGYLESFLFSALFITRVFVIEKIARYVVS